MAQLLRDQQLQRFKELWGNPERVKKMTLDEYCDYADKSSFVYMTEWGTALLGSINGSYAIKAGIYKKQNPGNYKQLGRQYAQDENYLWYQSLGDTPQEAFEEVKARILKIIYAIQNDKPLEIEDVYTLWQSYKYKIAFLYQCIFEKPVRILPVYSWPALSNFLDNNDDSKSMLDLYSMAIKLFGIKNQNDAFTKVAYAIYKNKPEFLKGGEESSDANIVHQEATLNPSSDKDLYSLPVVQDTPNAQSFNMLKNMNSEELSLFLKNMDYETKYKIFENLSKSDQGKIIDAFDNEAIEKIKIPMQIAGILSFFAGLIFIILAIQGYGTLNTTRTRDLIWFILLWIPVSGILYNCSSILKISCSTIKRIYKDNKSE